MNEIVGNSPRGAIPGNSHRERAAREPAQEEPREKVEKIISGNAVEYKPSWWKRVGKGMIIDDASSIGDFVLNDLVIPAIRNTLREIVVGTTDRALFGSKAVPRRPGGPGYGLRGTSGGIRSRYDQIETEPRRSMSRDAHRTHDFNEIVLETRSDAIDVIEKLQNYIDQYRAVSVSVLYDMLGITSGDYMNRKFGWTDLREAGSRQYRGGWLLDLPSPIPLS